MKKFFIIFSISCLLLSGCNNIDALNTDNNVDSIQQQEANQSSAQNEENISTDYPQPVEGSDLSTAVGGQPSIALDGIHHEMFYAIELDFVEHFIGEDEYFNNFVPKFDNTIDNTYRGLCEYYGISKDEYIEFWETKRKNFNESYLSETFEFEDIFPIETKYDAWFADDYETNPVFYAREYTVAFEGELVATEIAKKNISASYHSENRASGYTYRYYTIDGKLIDYVGDEKFKEYLSDINDVNILTFIEYFDIDKEDYLKIYSGYNLYPYNPEYLFSDENCELYFLTQQHV